MSELGLAAFFPKSAKRLVVSMVGSSNEFRGKYVILSDGRTSMILFIAHMMKIFIYSFFCLAHLHEMTIVNQLVSMALQLQQDINLTNHKYMAHQLALLYV